MTHTFSTTHLEMALHTDRRGRLSSPDGYGRNTGRCGDTVEMFVRIHEGRIQTLRYEAVGCLNTHACATALSVMATGKSVDDAWQIRPDHLIDYLQTLAPDHHHCAEVAAGALYRALIDLKSHQRRPWMRLYQQPHR